ncbi:MAG: ATP-binding cassette domain-containing protein [Verrucomicrobiota bacterium]
MLHLQDATLRVGRAGQTILQNVTLQYGRPHFGAVIGPSGCGKSTLLKVIAGLLEPQEGQLHWNGRDVEEKDIEPAELGYVPQFSICQPALTVRETLDEALRLRVRGLSAAAREERLQKVLALVGLQEIPDRRNRMLSGGQLRRLGLGLEIVSEPRLLLCDEVTSGLDPNSEDDIVRLLRDLAREGQRLVLSVTHSLSHLELYDSVTVLKEGRVVYCGAPDHLLHYFQVETPNEIFARLAGHSGKEWAELWNEHAASYLVPATMPEEEKPGATEDAPAADEGEAESPAEDEPAAEPMAQPAGVLTQFFILLARRWRLFFRAKGEVVLQVTLLFLFPAMVVPFAFHGLPQIQNLSLGLDITVTEQFRETLDFTKQTSQVGGLVSGLIMFQVILMTLMGSNNGAREIVSERLLYEKERLAGLSPGAYLSSKVVYVFFLVLVQSVWMTIFVRVICQFPGDLISQGLMLFLANAALTYLTLAVSAWSDTTEQSSLISIYFVGFQLPLSGALLAMPELLGSITRPFIAAYWSWSGFLQTLRGVQSQYYDLAAAITDTPLSSLEACTWVLVWHVVAGIVIAYFGCVASRWR